MGSPRLHRATAAAPPVSTTEPRLVTDLRLEPVAPLPVRATRRAAVGSGLGRMLVALDLLALVAGWLVAAAVGGLTSTSVFLVEAIGLPLVSVVAIATQHLYRARVCAVRAVEITRLGRASAVAAVVALLIPRFLPLDIEARSAFVGAGASFVLLVVARAAFRTWLQNGRRQGRFMRPVVVVGTNEEGAELVQLLRTHPELGFRVAGVVGDASYDPVDFSVPFLGPVEIAAQVVDGVAATGVLVAASALTSGQINSLVREFLRRGVHVHLSTGVRGIASSRLRSQPMAHEPLFYLEPLTLSRWQFVVKRATDLVVGTIGLLASLPVLLVAAAAIRIGDGGPVFFVQTRVGRDGRHFRMVKLRTMVPGAESMVDGLAAENERDGPLFKSGDDPRRTRVGRLLERLSVDELPQLLNVVRGEMSLVGPRPALPSEVAAFDDELRQRHRVLPGITGLWQVEARDNPSFAAYRRYDLFYIENWSVSLDLAILVATAQGVLFRSLSAVAGLAPHRRRDDPLTSAA